MRAGKLTDTITIERVTETIDTAGVPRETWTPLATMRAEIVQANTEEFLRTYGTAAEAVIIFRIRFIEMTPADRITFAEGDYDVKQIKEIGRRRSLEIRATAR